MGLKYDLTGQTFGKWDVICRAAKYSRGSGTIWICVCACGYPQAVGSVELRNGRSKGCLQCSFEYKSGENSHQYKGGALNEGSEAYFNRRVAASQCHAKEKGHSPVNLTGAELNQLYLKHDHCCDSCGKHRDTFTQSLSIDHCHETGEFRGFLCNRCNRLAVDSTRLRQVATYLGRTRC